MEILQDSYSRQFTCLRLSLTDACTFRCLYCQPGEVRAAEVREKPLSLTEIHRLVSAFSEMGIAKVRFTGGEPTLRKDLIDIARMVSRVPGIKTTAITTNGFRLQMLAKELLDAGVAGLNVSIDSLDPRRFEEITGQDRLEDVLAGVQTALELGFSPIKTNTVLLKGINDAEVESFISFAIEQPLAVRFIELMKTGDNAEFFAKRYFPAQRVAQQLKQHGWREVPRLFGDGPAVEYMHPRSRGSLGIIAAYSHNFCAGCNRLRVDSIGRLHLCLFGKESCSLRHLLQSDAQKSELQDTVRAFVQNKPSSHLLHDDDWGDTGSLVALGG